MIFDPLNESNERGELLLVFQSQSRFFVGSSLAASPACRAELAFQSQSRFFVGSSTPA